MAVLKVSVSMSSLQQQAELLRCPGKMSSFLNRKASHSSSLPLLFLLLRSARRRPRLLRAPLPLALLPCPLRRLFSRLRQRPRLGARQRRRLLHVRLCLRRALDRRAAMRPLFLATVDLRRPSMLILRRSSSSPSSLNLLLRLKKRSAVSLWECGRLETMSMRLSRLNVLRQK